MKKIIFISFIAASVLFTGCYVDDKPPFIHFHKKDKSKNTTNTTQNNTSSSNTQSQTEVSEVKGVAYDGILYGAKVEVYDENGNILATGITSSNPKDLGSFSIKVENLPKNYYIKITGGIDTGSDDIKNDNDYNSTITLQSIGEENNFTAVTPATTLIANLVKKGYSIDEAKKIVNNSLGLPADINITTLNPKDNLIAKKAAKTVILLAQVLPGNPDKNLNILANVITKEKIANINSAEPIEANISTVIQTEEKNSSVVKKYEQYSTLIINQLNETLNAYNNNNQISIETGVSTINILKNTLKGNNPYSIQDVSLFKQKLKTVLAILKSENITYNINEIKNIIQNNLDLNTTQIVDKIKSLNQIADISDENRKLLYQALIDENSSINLSKLNNIDLSNLNIENVSLNEKKLYYQLIASVMADNLDYYINTDFVDIQNYIIQNYFIKQSIDYIMSLKNSVLKKLIFKILKNHFYNQPLSESSFDEEKYNNFINTALKIEKYLVSLKDVKNIEIFKTLIQYVDFNDFESDFNSRILPLYTLLKNELLQKNIAFAATLDKFEQTYKNKLLNKENIALNDINKILIYTNEEINTIEPIMFPMIDI